MALPPRWVVSNAASVRREAAPYVGMNPSERLRLVAAACRAGARLLGLRADRARILADREPLPESTRAALARLRASAHDGRRAG